MKFREQTAKKKSIRRSRGCSWQLPCCWQSPYRREAARLSNMDGTAYAQDTAGFCLSDSKGATTKKKAVPFICMREKKHDFATANIIPT